MVKEVRLEERKWEDEYSPMMYKDALEQGSGGRLVLA